MSAIYLEKNALRQRAAEQRGFALPSAIFLLVVLAALGAVMLTLSSVQHATSAQDVQGARAYQAARAGIEWGLYQVMNPENTNPATTPFTTQYACPASDTTINNLQGTLAGFNVGISCSMNAYNEGGNHVRLYLLTSKATKGAVGSTNYVERELSVTVNTCRKSVNGENC